MEQPSLNKRKKIIVKIGIGLIVVLIFLTFISKTINGVLMPNVTATEFSKGSLQKKFEADGIIEIKNKHKVMSEGNWKVKKVAIKVNQRVKKGDIIAVVDTTDVKLELRNKELEIIKLENAIENQKENYKPLELSDLEREVKEAKADVDFAKKNLATIKELLESGAETKNNLETAEREYEDKLYIYDSKQKLLRDKPDEITKNNEELDRSIREKKVELDLKKAELESEKNKIPLDGKILSECEGVITAVNIEAGMSTTDDQIMAEIVNEDSTYSVFWYVDVERAVNYNVGDNIDMVGQGKSTEQSIKDLRTNYIIPLVISGKEFDLDKNQLKFWADIDENQIKKSKIIIYEGNKTKLTALESSSTYEFIIPRSCITETDGKNYLFIIKERNGALGVEKYVEKVETKILYDDDFSVAVDGHFGESTKIVADTSKPLKDNIQVSVR